MARDALADRAEIGSRSVGERRRERRAIARADRRRQFTVEKQPRAVLVRRRSAQAREPADEIGFPFVGDAGQMAPLVRDHERPFDRQQIARDERFEQKGIGHARHAGPPEVHVEERALGAPKSD